MNPNQEDPSPGNPAPVQPCLFSRGKHFGRREDLAVDRAVCFSFALAPGRIIAETPFKCPGGRPGEMKAGFSFKEAREGGETAAALGLCDDNSGGSPSLARAVTNPLHSVPDPRW